jgi:drug/metabolite transporter (DMT)-like permease
MATGARELSGQVDIYHTLFFRSLIGGLVILAIILISKTHSLLKTQRLGTHSLRAVFHFAAQYGWFVGIGLLPLAEVFALEFTAPFWTALLAAAFLKERLTARRGAAVILGIIGVVLIVKPSSDVFNPASLIVLAAAIGFAVAYVTTKSLAATDAPLSILWYMCLLQLPLGFFLALPNWQTPSSEQFGIISIISFAALGAHFCLNKAMQISDVTVVVTLDFLRLPAIAAVGIVFYQEPISSGLILGALLMLAGDLLNAYRANKQTDVSR